MEKLAKKLLLHYRLVLILTLIFCSCAAWAATKVKVRYDLTSYLPSEVNSTKALAIMNQEFGDQIPNLNLVAKVDTLANAQAFKERLEKIGGVKQVRWLDALHKLDTPLNFEKQALSARYWQAPYARYELTVESDNYGAYIADLRAKLAAVDVKMQGQAVELASANLAVGQEVRRILEIAVPFAFLILLLASTSFIEPILFLITIFAAVLLNMGTNYWRGEISFITQSIAGIIQLAVSMDYAVFLLNQFKSERQTKALQPALVAAMLNSCQAITASATTTFFGFIVLVFMTFKLGMDMGLVLALGIIFSLLAVLIVLPCLIYWLAPLIAKTSYRPLISCSKFRWVAKLSRFLRYPYLLAICLCIPILYQAQAKAPITYGMGNLPKNSIAASDAAFYEQTFGKDLYYALLIPQKHAAKVASLAASCANLKDVKSVISYPSLIGNDVPANSLPKSLIAQLSSPNYQRLLIQADLKSDSDAAFTLAAALRQTANKIIGEPVLTAGEAFSLYDMKQTIEIDNRFINRLIIAAIALVLLVTFKNWLLSCLIVLTIEVSIWFNLGLPYFTDTALNFIGYLVINTFQLGATVDYGIILCEKYQKARQLYPRQIAFKFAIAEASASLFAPAVILSACGFILHAISSIAAVNEIGLVLGRGALLSLLNVLILLPNLLYLCDPLLRFCNLPHFKKRPTNKLPANITKH